MCRVCVRKVIGWTRKGEGGVWWMWSLVIVWMQVCAFMVRGDVGWEFKDKALSGHLVSAVNVHLSAIPGFEVANWLKK